RCLDCYGVQFLCDDCTLRAHESVPLHQIQRWDQGQFSKVDLKSIGMRIRLGHPLKTVCPSIVAQNHFIIIDTDSAHDVAIDFCGCGHGGSRAEQLIAARLHPCTYDRPRAAISFRM
ncbi:hypothetical protein B0H16DRAFT_1229349, partial [Mycena metata]